MNCLKTLPLLSHAGNISASLPVRQELQPNISIPFFVTQSFLLLVVFKIKWHKDVLFEDRDEFSAIYTNSTRFFSK